MTNCRTNQMQKLATGIEGLDFVANGGLPRGRTTLICGSAGSAKTVLAAQYLAAGICQFNQPGVFVTFEERPADLRANLRSFGWNIDEWEQQGKWVFVDAAPRPETDSTVIGDYDLGGLIARIENAVKKTGAERLSMDSLGAIMSQFQDRLIVRREFLRIYTALKTLGITSIMTAERTQEYGAAARFGVEEFVADNVILLRNNLEDEKRRRTVEILKFRGTDHRKGEYPFTIMPEQGAVVIPLAAIELKQQSTNVRITSGNSEVDSMCDGGFFRDSIILVSGATGTGKTLMVTEFVDGGARASEKCLLLAFEESREQLFRNAYGWGRDFEKLEAQGLLKVICEYPEGAGLEDHLIRMKQLIEEFEPDRIAVDSLSALERVATPKSFREFVIAITSFIKDREAAGLFTSTTPTLLGGTSVTEAHISTITDSIILLRYVEIFGEMRRGMTVLKMRGSMHDKDIREFIVDGSGMHVGLPFKNVSGILSGMTRHWADSELERVEELFQD